MDLGDARPGVGGAGGSGGGEPVAAGSGVVVQQRFVPSCDGNGPDGAANLCLAATTTCALPEETRYVVFTRERITATGAVTVWDLRTAPPYVCLAPTDPALDPLLAIPGLVEQEFQRVVVLRAVPVVAPAPDTLINIPTRFQTSSTEGYDIPLTLLGHSVVITAQAQSWTWHFGDGQSQRVSAKGTKGRTTHTYARTGSRPARADIVWSGTFRVDGGPVQQVTGTATTTGQDAQVQVKQARSELVAR